MAKQDAMMSGAGWLGSFASKLTKALRKLGVSNEQIHELVKDGDAPDALVEKVAAVLAEAMRAAANLFRFRVVVNYSQTLEQMIAAGRYDWKNPDITEKHFPIPPSKRGKEEVAIELVHFDRNMESDEVLRELDKAGLRSAELPELLAFGAAHPEKQREFPIVALGSVWQHWHGDRGVASLYGGADERGLGLPWWSVSWGSLYRFAAVRK